MDEEPPVTKLTLTPLFVRSLTSLLWTDMEGVVSHFLGDADETDAMAVSLTILLNPFLALEPMQLRAASLFMAVSPVLGVVSGALFPPL